MSADTIPDTPAPPPRTRPVLVFLGRKEVAARLGQPVAWLKMPPHDAEIGERQGWLPSTIDLWSSKRPGPGRPRKDADQHGPRPVLVFLGRKQVAAYLGMAASYSLAGVVLPPHDAEIGDRRGWMPATIDVWSQKRPGKGRWGARTGQRSDGTTVPSR